MNHMRLNVGRGLYFITGTCPDIVIFIEVSVTERVTTSQLVFRMNMPHDDDEKCKEIEKHNETTFVMSRTLDHNSNPWEWSECSRSHVTHFIE